MDHFRTPPRQARPAKKGKSLDGESEGASGNRVAHTLTACCRCRHKKTRCDAGLPRCEHCERSGTECEYFDSAKGKKISRTYVIHLQNKVQQLEQELIQSSEDSEVPLDAEVLMRGAGLVRVEENNESRFLGPSSGIAMTRLVMELAKQNSSTKSIKEIVPETKAKQIKNKFVKESSKPSSKVCPLISSVAAPTLPTKELTDALVEIYNRKAQYLLPVLHEPSFLSAVTDVYEKNSGDAYKNFTLRMVIAISMQKLDVQFAGLADSYYLAALPFLEGAIQPMDLGTLQCFALITQYSLVTPTRTASLWVVGFATRLCQELGITDEATIGYSQAGDPLDTLEIDLRRRLFWIILSFEFGQAHSLGRPSSWAVSHDHINVQFFLPIDDHFITTSGVLPGHPLSMKKRIAIHFFKMRLFQSEIRHKLYLKKQPFPNNDHDPWFIQMEAKLNGWVSSSPRNDEGSGLSEEWFKVRNNTMVVFLYRPSPQVPEPSIRAAEKCFEASRFNIYKQREQIRTKSVDLTWIFTQSLFMALNTLLWALSYPEIRRQNPKPEVERYLYIAQESIFWASERWPGVESALELYDTFIQACLKAYDGNSDASYVVGSPANKPATESLSDVTTPPALSTPSTIHSSLSSTQNGHENNHPSPFNYVVDQEQFPLAQRGYDTIVEAQAGTSQAFSEPSSTIALGSQRSPPIFDQPTPEPLYGVNSHYHVNGALNPRSYNNRLPSPLTYSLALPTLQAPLQSPFHDQDFYLGAIGDQYAQYLNPQFPSQERLESLDLEQQSELMRTLERDRLDGVFHHMQPQPPPNFYTGTAFTG